MFGDVIQFMDENVDYSKDTQALIRDLNNGKEKAMGYLYAAYYGRLCRLARTFVVSAEDAEDVVQQLFIRIWEKKIKAENLESLDSYLCMAVCNSCVSFKRQRKEHLDLEKAEGVEEEMGSIDKRSVWTAVDSLPEQCRMILCLVVFEDMKYAEVAERLRISVNTVKTQMKIAYRELRKRLNKNEVFLLIQVFWKKK